MRKTILIAAASVALAACSKEHTRPIIEVEPFQKYDTTIVMFSFSPYIIEPIATKADVSIAELSKRLDVYIVEGDNIIEVHQNKDEGPEGFGTVSATLNKTKTYTLYAVAHKGSGESILENGIITFADNKITETFYYSTTFTPSSTTSLSCLMNRIVGMFKLTIVDALPANLAKMQFTISGSGLGYNVNGAPTNIGDKISIINNPSSANDGTTTFKIYCLAKTNEATPMDVTVTALDAEDNVIETKTFENVPIRAGYSTSFRGTFFITTSGDMIFTAPESWTNYDEETF